MCHGKEMPTDYESKRNGPDYIYDSYFASKNFPRLIMEKSDSRIRNLEGAKIFCLILQ